MSHSPVFLKELPALPGLQSRARLSWAPAESWGSILGTPAENRPQVLGGASWSAQWVGRGTQSEHDSGLLARPRGRDTFHLTLSLPLPCVPMHEVSLSSALWEHVQK